MEPQLEPEPSKPRRRVPRYVYLGIVAAVVLGAYAYFLLRDGNRLFELQSALDRDDPGWRMEEIWAEYSRTVPPDGKISMALIEQANAAIPQSFIEWSSRPESLPGVLADLRETGGHRVDPIVVEQAKAQLEELRPALELALKLREFPAIGGADPKLAFEGIGTMLPHIEEVRRVLTLLKLEGDTAAVSGEPDRAIVAAIACIHAGRAIGNEPFFVSQIVRRLGSLFAIDIAERALARGIVRAELLAELQDRLRDELDAPSMHATMRLERASVNQMYDNFRQGKDSVRAMAARYGLAVPGSVELQSVLFLTQQRAEQIAYLEYLNAAVEVAQAPEHERLALAKKLPATPKGGSIVAKLLEGLGLVGFPFEQDLSRLALVRSAIVAIGAERARMRTGDWPTRFDHFSNDPFTGSPLKVLRTDGVFVVYSVGPDGQDNGGKFWHTPKPPTGHDIGFRLVDVSRRTK